MRQCHVLRLVNYELQSLGNGHYAVWGCTHHQIRVNRQCLRRNLSYCL